jgi:glutathione S-transferase
MLDLYHHGTSTCSAKVRFALVEKNLQWTGHYIDILKGEQFSPAYTALNRKAVVPTLVHEGSVIVESTVICEYLDDEFPELPLRPLSARARANMRLWTKLVDEHLHPVTGEVTYVAALRHTLLRRGDEELQRFLDSRPPPGVSAAWHERRKIIVKLGFDTPGIDQGFRVFDQMFAQMEEALANGPWLLGEEFSLADVGLAPYVNRLAMMSMSGMWTINRPRVANWFDLIKGRQAFKSAVVDWCSSDLTNDMQNFGGESWPFVRRLLDR